MMICSQPKFNVRGTGQSKVSETLAPISTPKGQDNIHGAMGQVFCDGSGVNFTGARALGQMKILRLIAQGQPKISNVRQRGQREILLEIFRKYWFCCTIDIVRSLRDEKIMLLLYRFQNMFIWYL